MMPKFKKKLHCPWPQNNGELLLFLSQRVLNENVSLISVRAAIRQREIELVARLCWMLLLADH